MQEQKQEPKQKRRCSKAKRREIVQTVLTWGHIITMSALALAVVCNIGGLAVIVFRPEVAQAVTEYAEKWQTFFIAGILGYDTKSTIENALKIAKTARENAEGIQSAQKDAQGDG